MTYQTNQSRKSWGLFTWNNKTEGQFLRIIDYVTDAAGNGRYVWVARDRWWERSGNRSAEDPRTLYNSSLPRIMANNSSDFGFLQWMPNYDRPDRPTVDIFRGGLHATVPPLYEVIDAGVRSAQTLPHALVRGIRYSGRPTEKILLAFTDNGVRMEAAVLDRTMIAIHNTTLTLSEAAPNIVPRVTLRNPDIKTIEGRHGTSDRSIYIQPKLPESTSSVLIKPIEQLAQSYVKWYIRKEQRRGSGDTMRDAESIIELAFEKPEHLTKYLGVQPSTEDIQELQTALKATIHSNVEDISPIIYGLLKQDDDVMAEFRRQATIECEDEFNEHRQRLRAQLDDLRGQRDTQTKTVRQLTAQVKELNEQLQQKHRELRDAQAALEQQEEEQRKALQDLEANVALKIGLQQIAQQNRAMIEELATQHTTARDAAPRDDTQRLRSAPMMAPTTIRQCDDVRHALAQNLQALGCTSIDTGGKDSGALANFAAQLCRTLHATRLLAVDTAHVPAVANALAVAFRGIPAQHMGIPVDFSDFAALDTFLKGSESPVVVLDNVFDTVNESLLFALHRRHMDDMIVVLPIGSFANLRLVTPEVWQKVFYVPTAGLVELPSSANPTLYRSRAKFAPKHAEPNDVRAQLAALSRTVKLNVSAMVTPATIMTFGLDTDDLRAWVMPHLCLEMYAYQGVEAANALCGHPSNAAIAGRLHTLINRIDHGSAAR